jgi:chromosome condensin MukBEF MukE localization factor
MTNAGIFKESQLYDKLKKLKDEMKVLKAETKRGTHDLERIIETQAKEIDTLKTIIEIDRYTEKQLKERKQNEIRKKELE